MTTKTNSRFWRTPAAWMAAVGAALMLVNVVRSFTSPVDFAVYLGLPLTNPADAGLVYIYGLRALFIGLLVIALLVVQNRRALSLFAFTAVVMPIGDAWLTAQAGAPALTVGRHIGLGVFLLAVGVLMHRDMKRVEQAE